MELVAKWQVVRYTAGMAELLDAIRKAIESSEETRYRIAKDAGIAQSQLSRFMSGETGLSVESLEKLADCLGLEIIIRPTRRRRKKG